MKTKLLAACCLLAINATALAADKDDKAMGKPAADARMAGPMSRKVTKEDKKGIDAMYKSIEESMKKGDVNGFADNVDFPVMMVTDNQAGQFMSTSVDREGFVKMMGESMSHMPKDMKMGGKHSARFLSDSLAAVDEDQTASMGKMKGAWKSESLVVLKDGKWKMKMMAEAGWGDTMKEHAAASDPAAPPAAQPAVPVHH
jgi:hypothetical protein